MISLLQILWSQFQTECKPPKMSLKEYVNTNSHNHCGTMPTPNPVKILKPVLKPIPFLASESGIHKAQVKQILNSPQHSLTWSGLISKHN